VNGIRIGELRHRIMIQSVVRAEDGGGGATETWTTVAEVWAAVLPGGGSEGVAGDRLEGRVTHRIVMRGGLAGGAAPGPADRIVWGSRVFEVRAVIDEGERGRWLVALVEERGL